MIYCIILNWKKKEDTIKCANSVLKLKTNNFKIIIIDNNSQDNSYEEIKNQFKEEKKKISIIKTKENLGYAGGNNAGIKVALEDPEMTGVWILNNDTLVDPEALNELKKCAEKNKEFRIAGSLILDLEKNEKIQTAGSNLIKLFGLPRKILKNKPSNYSTSDINVDSVSGASMYIPREIIEKIGFIKEEYFLYWEETDYCFKFQKEFKRKPVCCVKSKVWHYSGAQVGRRTSQQRMLDSVNMIRFYKAHFPELIIFIILFRPIIDIISAIKNGEFKLNWLWSIYYYYYLAFKIEASESTKKYLKTLK